MKATLTQKKVPETEPGEARKEAPEAPPEKDLFAKYVFIPRREAALCRSGALP